MRGGPTSWGPLEFPVGADVGAWIDEHINTRDPVPAYVLLAGSPTHLPFELQSALSCHRRRWAGWTSPRSPGTSRPSTPSRSLRTSQGVRARGRDDRARRPQRRSSGRPRTGRKGPDGLQPRPCSPRRWPTRAEKRGSPSRELVQRGRHGSTLVDAGTEAGRALMFTASHGTGGHMETASTAQAAGNGFPVGQDGTGLTLGDLPDPRSRSSRGARLPVRLLRVRHSRDQRLHALVAGHRGLPRPARGGLGLPKALLAHAARTAGLHRARRLRRTPLLRRRRTLPPSTRRTAPATDGGFRPRWTPR